MKFTKIEELTNPLLNRRRLRFNMEFDNMTPSKAMVKKELVADLKVKEDLVDIKVKPKYGQRAAELLVFVYDDIDSLNKFKKKSKKSGEKKELPKEIKTEEKNEQKAETKEQKT